MGKQTTQSISTARIEYRDLIKQAVEGRCWKNWESMEVMIAEPGEQEEEVEKWTLKLRGGALQS